jgi:Sec-independent protein translocase protein TatA
MAGLFGIGGSAAKTDRSQQLTSWNDLQSLFNTGSRVGTNQISQGSKGLSDALGYFKKLMSGDRSQMASVLAPQISTISGQATQAKQNASTFGNRSGGTNAAIQASETSATQAVQQLFEMLGPEAAQAVASISGTIEGAGQNLLDLAGNSAAEVGKQSSDSRQTDVATQQAQQQAIIQGLVSLAGMA